MRAIGRDSEGRLQPAPLAPPRYCTWWPHTTQNFEPGGSGAPQLPQNFGVFFGAAAADAPAAGAVAAVSPADTPGTGSCATVDVATAPAGGTAA